MPSGVLNLKETPVLKYIDYEHMLLGVSLGRGNPVNSIKECFRVFR